MTRSIGLWLGSSLSLAMLSAPATASAPPPPPPYVASAGDVLTDAANKDEAKVARFFADDVVASINGQRIASGKADWLKWWSSDRSHYYGKTLGVSMGWKGDGALLVLDEFDTQNNAVGTPDMGDPRPSTRSTFYRFASDGLIHAIDISEVDSFFTGSR